MNWLIDHDAKFLTLDELLKYKEAGQFPERSVWINFDDMDHTIYDNAFPILKKISYSGNRICYYRPNWELEF